MAIKLPTGLVAGGAQALTDLSKQKAVSTILGSETSDRNLSPRKDWRVRITLPQGSHFAFRDEAWQYLGLNKPLLNNKGEKNFDGVIFPYTPTITVTNSARYSEQALTHSNYKSYFYEGSDVAPIQIAGIFTCQNQSEAIYLLSCIMFLRACTKMNYGQYDPMAGKPPTLVKLMGYGDHYLPGVSAVVTSVSHVMPEDCDYIKYEYEGTQGWMPISSTLTVTLQPVVSRAAQAQFDLNKFVRGGYVNTYPGKVSTEILPGSLNSQGGVL